MFDLISLRYPVFDGLNVGCLIKFSAFYFTSFTDLTFFFQLFLLCVFKSIKIVPLTFLFLRSSLLNKDTDSTASVPLVSILTEFHCILEQFLSGASIALRTDDVTKRNPHQDSDKHWPFLQEGCMETHSLRSALLALLAFWGAFQFRNSRKIQENIM